MVSDVQPGLFHFRSAAGSEVDLVLEDRAGRLVGIEIKARATVNSADFRGLRTLAEVSGVRFARGVVLHTGKRAVAFGDRLWALPMSTVWSID